MTLILVSLGWLPWAVCKQAWTWNQPWFGVRPGSLDYGDSGGLAQVLHECGVDVTVVAAMLATGMVVALTARSLPAVVMGTRPGELVRRWQVVVRWLLVLPAVLAIPLLGYGLGLCGYSVLAFAGVVPAPTSDDLPRRATQVIIVCGGLAFTGIGASCLGAVMSFVRRTHSVCRAPDVAP